MNESTLTIRLDKELTKQLAVIQTDLNCSTSNAAIRTLIATQSELKKSLSVVLEDSKQVQRNYHEILKLAVSFINNQKAGIEINGLFKATIEQHEKDSEIT